MTVPEVSIAEQVRQISHVAAYMTDDLHRITIWNENAQKLLGYSEGELLEQSETVFRLDPYELTNHGGVRFTWRIAKDGARLFVMETVIIIEDPDSKKYSVMKILEDYTDQLTFSEQIELWLQQDELVTIADQKTLKLTHVSQKFADALGYTLDEMTGLSIESLMAGPQISERYSGNALDLIRDAKMIRGFNFKRKDGESFSTSLVTFQLVENHPSGSPEVYWVGRIRAAETEIQQSSMDYFF